MTTEQRPEAAKGISNGQVGKGPFGMWQRGKDDAAIEAVMGQLASDDATVGQSAKARWQQTITNH